MRRLPGVALLAGLACSVATAAAALDLPAGTLVAVRLATHLSSRTSRAGDPVEAVVIAPVPREGEVAIPAGWAVRGMIGDVGAHRPHDPRAFLLLDFTELVPEAGPPFPLAARVVEVDDARETVGPDGQIQGLEPLRVRPGKLDMLLILAAHAHPVTLGILAAGKLARHAGDHAAIDYAPGVDLTLELTRGLTLAGASTEAEAGFRESTPEAALEALVAGLPPRTLAAKFNRPSDPTNVLLLGTRGEVEAAFKAAGWTATREGIRPRLRAFWALCERRGYKPAPMSLLELDGRRPDLVFEKQNNTLKKRHHVRLWQMPGQHGGRPIWVGAATHDVGLRFDARDRVFTHRVDRHIDLERAKIADDLAFAGRVESLAYVERPGLLRTAQNGTGDRLETDGRMVVLELRSATGASAVSRGSGS